MKYTLISLSILVSGCSQASLYETFRNADKYHCEDILNAQEKMKCKEAPRANYEEYQKYLQNQNRLQK